MNLEEELKLLEESLQTELNSPSGDVNKITLLVDRILGVRHKINPNDFLFQPPEPDYDDYPRQPKKTGKLTKKLTKKERFKFNIKKRKEKNEDIKFNTDKELVPTTSIPGSEEKIQVLTYRYNNKLPLWHKDDTKGCKPHKPFIALYDDEDDDL